MARAGGDLKPKRLPQETVPTQNATFISGVSTEQNT